MDTPLHVVHAIQLLYNYYTMAEDQWYHQLSVSQLMEYPGVGVTVAVVLGLLTVCVTVLLFCKRQTKSQKQHPETKQQENGTSSNSAAILKVAKSKGVKGRQPKKHSPTGHPLLAADFKGHTGAVLSLNFELGGKYLASCSEGVCVCMRACVFVCACVRAFVHTCSGNVHVQIQLFIARSHQEGLESLLSLLHGMFPLLKLTMFYVKLWVTSTFGLPSKC